MNITEAHQINVLLAWFCQRPRGRNREIPHRDQAVEAAVWLADRARARLGTGIDLTYVRDHWPAHIHQAGEQELHQLRNAMQLVVAALDAWQDGMIGGREALGTIRDDLNRTPIPGTQDDDARGGDDQPGPTAREQFEASVAELAAAEQARHRARDDAEYEAFSKAWARDHCHEGP